MRRAPLFLAAALAASASAQDAPYLFRPLGGEEFSAQLLRVERGIVHYRRAGAGPEQLELDLLAAMLRPAAPPVGALPPPALWLRSGASFSAQFVTGGETHAEFAMRYSASQVRMPWRYVRALCFDGAEQRDAAFMNGVVNPPEGTDLLFVRRGDDKVRVSARFTGFDGGQFRVEVSGTERSLPLDRVYGLVLGDYSGAPPDAQPNPRARVFAMDGYQVEGVVTAIDSGVWRVRVDEGVEFAIPDSDVRGVRIASDRMVFLSDLEYELEQTAALDRVWRPLVDHGPGGGPIVVGGKAFARGLVLFPRTKMSFVIEGRFDALEATLGFDEGAGPGAHAVFSRRRG